MHYCCPTCRKPLVVEDSMISCASCGSRYGVMDGGLMVFDGCLDKHNFFEKQAIERLNRYYEGYDEAAFRADLEKSELWQMDERNKRVGITRKKWWETHVGRITGKSILEIGCGVNYIVPYFASSGNDVVAFDICRESVEYSRNLLAKVVPEAGGVSYAVADATKVEFNESFDFVDISNVLHHIEDKPAVFERAYRALKPGGRMLIVEPNYYYPPRWAIETDLLDPYNILKNYFVANDLIEKGEKAIIFSDLMRQIADAGFQIVLREKDNNYLGYFSVYWFGERTLGARIAYALDKYVFSRILPRLIAPFEFVIARKPA